MTIYFSDEDSRLTENIRGLMTRAAEAAVGLEFSDLFSDAGIEASSLNAEIGVTVVGGDEIRALNSEYRGIDRVTDVLSFPQYDDADDLGRDLVLNGDDNEYPLLIGDVVICYDRAAEQAEEYGTGIVRELVYLFVHSILHLMGYDHEEDDERREMRAREEEIMNRIGVSR